MNGRTGSQSRPRKRSGRRTERGNALTLAVVILLAMIALGLLALRSTTQNIAGSGNLRMSKQARYVAEVGLYHAITLVNQRQVDDVLALRQPGWHIEVDSEGRVRLVDLDGNVQFETDKQVPGFLSDGPNPLGQFGEASGLVPSYRVSIEGFLLGRAPAGTDLKTKYCQLDVTSRGFVADRALPDDAVFNSARGVAEFAEFTLRAGTVVGPEIPNCP